MHLIAAAEMTPSGVPPIPHSRSTGELSLTASSAALTSPSRISRTRAPASRTSRIISWWRSRSSITTITSRISRALALGDQLERLRQRAVEVEQVGDLGAPGDLLHVHARSGIEHRSALGQRDDRQRARHPERGQAGPLQRVDRHVDLRQAAVADPLAVVEHRSLVLLALADDDHAVHRDGIEHQPHGIDRRLVGALLVAAADHPRGGQRRRLGHPHQLERQVAIRQPRDRPPARSSRRSATLTGRPAVCGGQSSRASG